MEREEVLSNYGQPLKFTQYVSSVFRTAGVKSLINFLVVPLEGLGDSAKLQPVLAVLPVWVFKGRMLQGKIERIEPCFFSA